MDGPRSHLHVRWGFHLLKRQFDETTLIINHFGERHKYILPSSGNGVALWIPTRFHNRARYSCNVKSSVGWLFEDWDTEVIPMSGNVRSNHWNTEGKRLADSEIPALP